MSRCLRSFEPRLRSTLARAALLVAVAWPLAAVGPAVAADPVPAAERPATWDMSLEELQAIGLGQHRGDPVPVPAEYPRRNRLAGGTGGVAGGVEQPPPAIIFVNFDGATLTPGMDSAQSNITQIPELAGVFAPYGDGDKRAAVVQAVRADWAAYNIEIVDERPAAGEYVMNMTGPTNPYGGGVLGIAPLDCFNMQTHSNITYAFHSVDDMFSAPITATTIGQEVAHSFGLEHVDEPSDIMNPVNAGADPGFLDSCIALVGGALCTEQHAANCPGGQQNSHQELLALFGPAVIDTDPPVVLITAPLDGQEYEAGGDFNVVVSITDDSAIVSAQLLTNGEPVMLDTMAPYGWAITNVPEGEYTLEVTAVDEVGNEGTSAPVTITVVAPVMDGTDSDTDGGAGQDDDAKGCGCTQGPGRAAPLWAAGVVLVALRSRRRP